jgi:hypothetical protein
LRTVWEDMGTYAMQTPCGIKCHANLGSWCNLLSWRVNMCHLKAHSITTGVILVAYEWQQNHLKLYILIWNVIKHKNRCGILVDNWWQILYIKSLVCACVCDRQSCVHTFMTVSRASQISRSWNPSPESNMQQHESNIRRKS